MARVAVLAVLASVLAGCPPAPSGSPADAGVTPARAPPDLSKPPTVRSTMWSLAVHTNQIAVLAEKPELTPTELAALKAAVDDVAKLARGLAVDEDAMRHPFLRKNLAEFETKIVAAQAGLAKEPADRLPLRALSQACQQCHAGAVTAPFKL